MWLFSDSDTPDSSETLPSRKSISLMLNITFTA